MVLPDSNNIFENMGVNGNSAICKPSGDVKLQSSSMAGKKNMKNLTTMDAKWYQSTLGLWSGEIIFFIANKVEKCFNFFLQNINTFNLLKLMNTMYYYIIFYLKSKSSHCQSIIFDSYFCQMHWSILTCLF